MNTPNHQQIITSNRDAWNESARFHQEAASWTELKKAVATENFSCLDEVLTGLLERVDVKGKDVVQLCCNNGRECLSLMALGAASVVGVDQSAAFLAQAAELNALSPYTASFVEADIHALPGELQGRFDVALITIGVLNWMPDIQVFMAHVAATLKPGGTLVIYETHPVLEMLDPEASDPYRLARSYFTQEPYVDDRVIVYEGQASAKGAPSYWFAHTLGEVVTAVLDTQLSLTHLKEYPHSNREELYDLYEHQDVQIPMCFTLTALKR